MRLIVGLGNVGDEYEKTRHNVGFRVVDEFFRKVSIYEPIRWHEEKKFHAYIAHTAWQSEKSSEVEKVILVKPTTFMNKSGEAVKSIAQFYGISGQDIWIIHDDVDFTVGVLKIRFGGASAGHNGIGSVIDSLGYDGFWRFRIGVGRPHGKEEQFDIKRHVLESFSQSDNRKIKEVIKRSVGALELALEKSMDAAMNRYNVSGI